MSTLPDRAPSVEPRPWGRPDRLRLILWAAIAFLLPVLVRLALHLEVLPSSPVLTVRNEFQSKGIAVVFVLLATWVVSRIEKRPLDDYGIPPRQAFGRRFWEGAVWGVGALSIIPAILWGTGHFRIDSIALHGTAVARYAVGWGAVLVVLAMTEEFAFRGYWLFSFARRMRFWPAALFLSAVFAAAHLTNAQETVLGIAEVVATGLLFCLTIRRTGNLWFAVGFHAAWDWAQTFLWGTPDSGLLGVGRFLNSSIEGPRLAHRGRRRPGGERPRFPGSFALRAAGPPSIPEEVYPDRPV